MRLFKAMIVLAVVPFLGGGTCSEPSGDPCETPDIDGDGADSMNCGGLDCDDLDRERTPGRPEICDPAGRDEDCDGATFGERDADGDTFPDALCCNGATCGVDCDDMRPSVHPTATEACNQVDDDCDRATDEGVSASLYNDSDRDGYGAGVATAGCFAMPGLSYLNNDCDDGNAAIVPGAVKCLNTTEYQICNNGGWSIKMTCPQSCVAQPNGTGVCI